eukprot:SAG11_NODE_22379_length_407_cov_0.672078_1_plen_104_part_00
MAAALLCVGALSQFPLFLLMHLTVRCARALLHTSCLITTTCCRPSNNYSGSSSLEEVGGQSQHAPPIELRLAQSVVRRVLRPVVVMHHELEDELERLCAQNHR